MNWGITDVILAGVLLVGVALLYWLLTKKQPSFAYRAVVGTMLVALLLLIWAELAIGLF
jgi:hypothetical protein